MAQSQSHTFDTDRVKTRLEDALGAAWTARIHLHRNTDGEQFGRIVLRHDDRSTIVIEPADAEAAGENSYHVAVNPAGGDRRLIEHSLDGTAPPLAAALDAAISASWLYIDAGQFGWS